MYKQRISNVGDFKCDVQPGILFEMLNFISKGQQRAAKDEKKV